MLTRLTCQGVCEKPRPEPNDMAILFAAFWMSYWPHTLGVLLQDSCAYTSLMSTLQKYPLLRRVDRMSAVCISEGIAFDLSEQEVYQLSVSDLSSQQPSLC